MYYISALGLSILLCSIGSKFTIRGIKKKSYLKFWKTALCFLPLFVLAAFRWNLGVDSFYGRGHYSSGYRLAASGQNALHYAIGFFKFFEFCAKNHIPLFWCYFIITTIYFFSAYYLINKLELNLTWAVLAFFGIDLYIFSFSAIRQSLSFAFAFLALAVLFKSEKRRYLYATGLITLGTLVHHSLAGYYLLILFDCVMKKRKFDGIKKKTIIELLIGGIIASPLIYIVAKKILSNSMYAINQIETKFTPSYLVFSGVLLWCGYKYWKGIVIQNSKYSLLIVSTLALFIITIISPAVFHMDRVFHLFGPIFLIYIPALWKSIPKTRERYLVFFIIVLMMAYLIKGYFIPGYQDYEAFGTYHSVFENWDYYTHLGTY